MIKLFEQDIQTLNRQSSKGNQLKWKNNNIWYKADSFGYEGLAEYVVSELLELSTLNDIEKVKYQTEQITYKSQILSGCRSINFLPENWQLVTLERLFQLHYGEGLNKCIYSISSTEERVKFLVSQTERLTGLEGFGTYIGKLATIDALFLNEDRHTHNIALLLDDKDIYHYCPFFDQGSALLSDTTMDYPVSEDVLQLMSTVKAKTIHPNFDEQLDAVEKVCGQCLNFHFDYNDIKKIMDAEPYYPHAVKERVTEILLAQRRKYKYLFTSRM